MSQSVRELVSDKDKQGSDSGPIKRKNWVHLIKTEMIFFAIGQSQPGISYLHKKLLLSAGYFASTLKLKLWQRPGHYEY